MAIEIGKDDQPVPPTDTGVRRRGLLSFGTLMAAFTGASAVAALGASSAQAAPGDKYVPIAEKGAPSGVAALDGGAKIPPSQLPDLSATILDKIRTDSVPKWKAVTAYLAGDQALSPGGDIVSAKVNFTSGAFFTAADWNFGTTFIPEATDQTVTGSKTFSSLKGLRTTTWFGIQAGVGSARGPFVQNSVIDGSTLPLVVPTGANNDTVGSQINVKFQGGFTGQVVSITASVTTGQTAVTLTTGSFRGFVAGAYIFIPGAGPSGAVLKTTLASITDSTHAVMSTPATATVSAACTLSPSADPSFLFLANDYGTTGSASTDLAGIDAYYGRLTEVHLNAPNTVLNTMLGLQTQANIESSAKGSTITNAYSLKAIQPTNLAGITVTNAYGLYSSGTPTPGATNSWGLYVDNGGKSKLTGATTVAAANTTDVALTIQQPLGATADAFAVWDFTFANRRFHVGSSGTVAAQGSFTSSEGLTASTTIGAMSNGKSGVRFGNGGSTEIRLNAVAGVIEANAKFVALTGLGVGNSASATSLGTLAKKVEIFDAAGASLGFVPVYTTIT